MSIFIVLIIISLYCFIAGIIFGLCDKYKVDPIVMILIAIFWPLVLMSLPFAIIAIIGSLFVKRNDSNSR